ncbi:MAG: helix-turn-helix domain-containing protein [Ahniella sp.]|nr:helix-turn-helix domain-containing protein [Ahniella sp.]
MAAIRIYEPPQLTIYLRELRRVRGWTQAEFGHRLGVSQSRIAEIERHPERISVKQLLEVLAILGGGFIGQMPQVVAPQGIGPDAANLSRPVPLVQEKPTSDSKGSDPAEHETPGGEW